MRATGHGHPRSDPYYRNNAIGAAHLQMAGHTGARAESWGGGTEGIVVPHPNGLHQVEIGQSPDVRGEGWQFRVVRHPDDPEYDQDGLHLGRAQINRLPSPGPERKQPRDDEHNANVQAHPTALPAKLSDFLEHPHVRAAIQRDENYLRSRGKGGGNLGPQFG